MSVYALYSIFTAPLQGAGPYSAVGSASDSRARGPTFDTQSGYILLFLLPLVKVCAQSTG